MSAAAVILAAGAGRRLGGAAKALLVRPGGGSFLACVVDVARSAGVSSLVVVVGAPYRAEVARAAAQLRVHVADNHAPDRGMASSVAIGFEYAAARFGTATRALLWPVDHAAVSASTVRAVLAASGDIVVPTYGDRGGHPTCFHARVWPELVGCGDAADGARGVVRVDPARVERIVVDDRGVIADVDTPGQLAAATGARR